MSTKRHVQCSIVSLKSGVTVIVADKRTWIEASSAWEDMERASRENGGMVGDRKASDMGQREWRVVVEQLCV